MAARTQNYEGRGVYVPDGMSADEIMHAADVLEREFEIEPYTSRAMARAVLQTLKRMLGTKPTPHKKDAGPKPSASRLAKEDLHQGSEPLKGSGKAE